MKISETFPSNYLKAADLQGRTVRATINIVKLEEIGGEHKPIVYFEGKDRGLVLNKTNGSTIAMAYGDDTDTWAGEDVELFPMAVAFQGQMVPAIRVRVPAATKAPQHDPIAPNARTRAAPSFSERNPPPATDDEVPF